MANFARSLRLSGLKLFEVERDGNCFFRAIATGLGEHQGCHASYRERVVSHMEAHPDDYTPFLTFGEGDEEEDADFEQYLSRMRRDGEWAGQPELLAAVQALRVHLVVYQEAMPSYRIECADKAAACVRVSYHDGEHYNAVLQPAAEEERGGAGFGAEGAAGAKGGASRNKGNGKGGGGPGGGGGGGGNGKGGGSSRGGGDDEAEGGGSCGVAHGDAEGDGGSEMGEAAAEAAVRSGCSFEVSAEQVAEALEACNGDPHGAVAYLEAITRMRAVSLGGGEEGRQEGGHGGGGRRGGEPDGSPPPPSAAGGSGGGREGGEGEGGGGECNGAGDGHCLAGFFAAAADGAEAVAPSAIEAARLRKAERKAAKQARAQQRRQEAAAAAAASMAGRQHGWEEEESGIITL